MKLLRIHTVKTIDIETPSDERCPLEIKGFYEQQETDETDKKNKFEEAEKSIKKIREEQKKKLDEEDKSSGKNLRDGCEEQEDKCNEEDISSPEKLADGSKEQERKLSEGDISSPEKLGDSSEEQDKLNEGNKSSPGKAGDGSEEQEEELNEGDKSSSQNVSNNSEEQYKVRGEKFIYRLAVLLLILTGFFEDFPVVIATFYTAVSPACGTPARQEVGSVLTMTTIISAMMNSLWTMIILFCELCGCQKWTHIRLYFSETDSGSNSPLSHTCYSSRSIGSRS